MKTTLSYFTSSFVFCIIAIALTWWFFGPQAVLIIIFLTILETSLSFDNAVVNAGILKNWDEVWRRRFLVWGLPIAVFGMRLVFPILIVAVAGKIGPISVLQMAIHRPNEYHSILSSAHHQIAAFGGTFLLMVFFDFFVSTNKTLHWVNLIEKHFTRLGKMEAIEAAMTLVILILISGVVDSNLRSEFVEAGVWGVITFIFTKGLGALLQDDDSAGAEHIVKQGVAGFLYLELIDASFSFDGVIGAFALTNNLFIIVLGLGAGAMFVRSFTLLLVNNGTLGKFRYLEHGAFWAIGTLAILMLGGVVFHISEAITGTLGAALIAASLASSILANRKESAY